MARIVVIVVCLGVVAGVTLGLSRLEPAAPGVERQTLLMDTVKQGSMVIEVRGAGRLMSEDMLVLSATVPGRVVRILVEPGTPVDPNTIVLELSNPEVELQWLDARSQLSSAQARLNARKAELQDRLLETQAGLAQSEADLQDARCRAKVDEQQFADGLISELQVSLTRSRVQQLENLLAIRKQRFEVFRDQTMPAQLMELEAGLKQAESLHNLREGQFESLHVRAGGPGVLAPVQTPIEPGQQVSTGQVLGRITNPRRLKAQLQIPQGQARDVLIGLPTEIDTYNGVVAGRVSRIEPTVMEGNVTVDIRLDGALPKGARPDLSVVGTIQIDRLSDILYVGRPVMAAADSRTSLFKVVNGGRHADRMPVQFGRTSVSTIEVVEGLALGDEIILSDVSQWDAVDRIRLK